MKKASHIVELFKSGNFYNVFGDDAVIIHCLMNYKILSSKGGVGFPESAYNKVINILDDEKISYIVYEKDELVDSNDFKKLNCYKKVLNKGLKKIEIEERYKKIEEKLRLLNFDELENILKLIEDLISNYC